MHVFGVYLSTKGLSLWIVDQSLHTTAHRSLTLRPSGYKIHTKLLRGKISSGSLLTATTVIVLIGLLLHRN